MSFQGRRLEDCKWPPGLPVCITDLKLGDYWKCTNYDGSYGSRPESQPKDEVWGVYVKGVTFIPLHEVDEHEDGTISVIPKPGNSNSILIKGGKKLTEELYHGYIRHGVWD